VNGKKRGQLPPTDQDKIIKITLASGENGINYNFAEVAPSSLCGVVYADVNCNGKPDGYDGAIPYVCITLKNNNTGQTWNTVSGIDGTYHFDNLRPGAYTITEKQPDGVKSGDVDAGSLGGCDNDSCNYISRIYVCCGQKGTGYNFGEVPCVIPSYTTTTADWWKGSKGQSLIKSLNGGPTATALGNWIAASFPNLFGNLAGKTNADIAAYYVSISAAPAFALEYQFLDTVLSIYVTTRSLAGNAGASYGVRITDAGLGPCKVTVHNSAPAFGLPSGATTTVLELIRRADAASYNGVAYDTNHNGVIDTSGPSGFEKSYRDLVYILLNTVINL